MDDVQREEQQVPAAGPRRSGVSVKTSIVRVDARQNRAGSLANKAHEPKKVLVMDIGGTSMKLLVIGQRKRRMLPSGRKMTPDKMVRKTLELVSDWAYSVVSIGYPGPVLRGRPICEPYNLGRGWVGFDFAAAFRRPVKVVNDAAMQALGSYNGGTMLFLGLGTGLGTAMIVDGIIEPMELGHLRYKKATYENYLGRVGLKRLGKKRWRHYGLQAVPFSVLLFFVRFGSSFPGGERHRFSPVAGRPRFAVRASRQSRSAIRFRFHTA
jgi:ROK family